jgi:hypothetical protein
MNAVTFRDGIATITTRTGMAEVHVSAAAHLVRQGELAATSFDILALAAGYEALERERDALRAELAAARAGTIGREHAEAMQCARKVIAELRQASDAFFEVYDQGEAPDSGLDDALRGKLGEADYWLLCDVSAATARVKLLEGGAA